MAAPVSVKLLDHIAACPVRASMGRGKLLYPLPEILLLVLSGRSLGWVTSWRRRCGGRNSWRSSGISAATRTASHATTRCVTCLPHPVPELFKACFLAWISDLCDDDPTSSRLTGRRGGICPRCSPGRRNPQVDRRRHPSANGIGLPSLPLQPVFDANLMVPGNVQVVLIDKPLDHMFA
jgi:hypothetical protein